MTTVRSTLVGRLAEAFGCDRYHLYTGHPLLRETQCARRREDSGFGGQDSGFRVQNLLATMMTNSEP
jgi:hypothetical protein